MQADAAVTLSDWIGREESLTETLAPSQALGAAAMLDLDASKIGDGSALPLLWHWFYFLPRAPQSKLSADGHPERGGFLPPITLPRRMFAGARVTVHQLLTLGRPATRQGTILNVRETSGKSGKLAFVTVGYRFIQDGVTCLEEEQDIVYREPGAPVPSPVAAERPALASDAFSQEFTPDSRLLFRFSALTFNAHRIHYDRPYAMAEEGYPGLVVHGPLIALLLAELAQRNAPRSIATFSFKGMAPLFDIGSVRLSGVPGERISLAAHAVDGTQTMAAEAALRP
jgi:3-methylfumaryl-CoA hydratase